MAEDAEIRRANFKRLWELWGSPFSPTDAAARLWGSPAQWSDLYHGRKSFGEKLARKIEDRLGLVRLSLDDQGGPQVSPIAPDVMDALQSAPPELRQQAENVLRALLNVTPASAAVTGTNGKQPRSGKA